MHAQYLPLNGLNCNGVMSVLHFIICQCIGASGAEKFSYGHDAENLLLLWYSLYDVRF